MGERGRLAAVGAVVLAANLGLLVLQLVAGRLLAPFVGSSLETWAGVIAAFLAGIALGNAAGGPLADRRPRPSTLAGVLLLGAAAAGWMLLLPRLLAATDAHAAVPLGGRIPLLAAGLCLPPGFALSLLTPVAVRLTLTDARRSGRAAGRMFALSTVGCLAGNYLTGFVLIPGMTVDAIVLAVVGLLVALATTCTQIGRREVGEWGDSDRPADAAAQPSGPQEPLSPGLSYAVVFLASFAGMALELSASRMMAQVVGVSLDSWTGVIGVMLAGTAAGNWLGGRLADRPTRGRLGWWLLAAAAGCVLCLGVNALLWLAQPYLRIGLVPLILLWTGVVFLPPMLLLGTVSPQVVRLATADLATAGRTAGRVYAVSTAGAIAGTLATGFVLIRAVGMYRTVLLAAVLAAAAAVVGGRAFAGRGRRNLLAAVAAAVLVGLVAAGPVLDQLGVVAETNYYTIRVVPVGGDGPDRPLQLQLDRLIHSQVRPDDPLYLYYRHEQIQLEFLKGMGPAPRALVVGGGGYTFPRAARTVVPGSAVDVVEIDPGVTRVAYSHLGLDPALGVTSVHMDGRQFVAERAAPAGYDLITLDAVNDLSVPAHLLTVECNAAVRRALAPGGVYLVTVIDGVADGRLWKAVFHTLKAGFPHVALLSSEPLTDPDARPSRAVLVLYAADRPPAAAGHGGATHVVPDELVGRWLATDPPLVLTDQYAPVDNLMAGVFRRR